MANPPYIYRSYEVLVCHSFKNPEKIILINS